MPQKREIMKKKEPTAEERKAKMAEDREFLQKFMDAALKGDGETVETLADEYSSMNNLTLFQVYKGIKDGSKRTALHFACSSPSGGNRKDDIVTRLLNNSKLTSSEIEEMITSTDEDGLTPLMLVCNQLNEKSFDRIKILLKLGGSKIFTMKSKAGAMALHYAAGSGASKEIIKFIYDNGKEALSSLSASVGSPLHWASGVPSPTNYSETIKALLNECVADVNVLNERGISSLILATASGNDIHAKILVESGADRGFILGGNITVFHIAAEMNLLGTLDALVNLDTSVSTKETTTKCLQIKNENGETPLDVACKGSKLECVKIITGISDNDKANELMEKTREDLQQRLKASQNSANTTESNDDNDLTPQQVAEKILANKHIITEKDKDTAAQLKANGNSSYAKKEWESAINFYSKAIEINPVDETYYSNRSACYMALKRHDEALFDALVAHTLKPQWTKGCYRVSVALLALERFEDAAVSAFEGLSMDQDNQELKSLFQKCIKKGRKEHELQSKQDNSVDSTLKKQTFFEN